MDTEALVRQFEKDPAPVFLDIIRASARPILATEIKRRIVDAGAGKADVDRHWKRIQRMITLHPQIAMANNRYEWLGERRSAQSSLRLLTGRLRAKLPQWLTGPWVQNVAAALDRAGATDAGWAEHQFQQARLVADLAVAIEVLEARGDTIAEVAALLAEETRRKRLWRTGTPGETVPFDPEAHEPETETPQEGTAVRVVRSGYVWRGGGEPIVAAKAVIAQ